MKRLIIIVLTISAISLLMSCKKYLDLKPDNSLVVPKSLNDCVLLMDDYATMNASYPSDAEAASDNYYVTDATFNALTNSDSKDNYIWEPQAKHPTAWSAPYKVIFNSNQVLQLLDNLNERGLEYDRVKGTALFFRAFALYHLAQLFIPPYNSATANKDLGLPIRLSPDLELKIQRATVQQTYERIVQDFKDAVQLLPVTTSIKTRPNKAAALAALARTYLAMEDYTNAGNASRESLSLYDTLMDYNSITSITQFNPEVIFHAITSLSAGSTLLPQNAKIASELYDSYLANDRRKSLFFRANTGSAAGSYVFAGSYNGSVNSTIFTGLATDELYLISAECYARTGNVTDAMLALNTLLKKRYESPFAGLLATNASDALSKILIERRKELVFRNQRWTDLRRLNKDPQFGITLTRPRNNISYKPLVPGDLRYTMLIPIDIETSLSGIEQNPR